MAISFQTTQAGFDRICDPATIQENLHNGIYSESTRRRHPGAEGRSAVYGNTFYSSSDDNSVITKWDVREQKCLNTFQGYGGIPLCFVPSGENFYSGFTNGKIKVWNENTGEYLGALEGHKGSVNSLIVDGRMLYSSSEEDKTIRVWDTHTKKCVQSLEGQQGFFALHKDRLCSSSEGTAEIKIFDLRKGVVGTLSGHQGSITSIGYIGGRICSSSTDKTVKFWDPDSEQCSKTMRSPVTVRSLKVPSSNGSELILENNTFDRTWNFAAKHLTVFTELANQLKSGKEAAIEEAMDRFKNMPADAKNLIYGRLYYILAPFPNDYFGCAEHAFHGLHGLSATPEQKAEAIERYVASQPRE